MIKDIIGLRAEIKVQYDEAVEMEEAAKEAYQDAVKQREKLQEFLEIVEGYRGGGDGRRNASRVYNAPGSGSKASEIEAAVLDAMREAGGPMKSDEILDALVAAGHVDLLPGDRHTTKLARLSTYLTRMHRREGALIAYDRDQRTYSLRDGA
jgi:hypothetical protein